MKFSVILASAALWCKAFAAELRVEDKDLPRVPATEATNAAATFQLRDGFRAELVASEPLVVDPVAMAFDENGRLYVIEMRDYSERRQEQLGRVKLLEDTNGDGRFDKATIFADKLAWPTAIICYDGGVFIGASPDILYYKDTNGDGVADRHNVAFTGFGTGAARLNVQQLLNSFTWGIDNRIHGALGGNPSVVTNASRPDLKPVELRNRDFSFDPRALDLSPESGGGQWGISFDDEGNKFTCSNARHIITTMYEDRFGTRSAFASLPPPDVNVGPDSPAAEIYRVSPEEPWRVLRTRWRVAGLVSGPVEGGGRASGYFSGASGITIYRGDAFPEEFHGNAFIADCGSNLIHRKRVRRSGLTFLAERPDDERKKEFLASRDNWFRPVSMANAPDGGLYVIDMYRETVEHPWSLPPELKSKLDLNSGNDRGRIFRIVPTNFVPRAPVRLGSASTEELVRTLEHRNGWHRDTAARLLCERRDSNSIPALATLVRSSSFAPAKIHALYTLDALGALQEEDVRIAVRDTNAAVRVHGVRLARDMKLGDADWLQALASDEDIRVRFQLALTQTDPITLVKLIHRDVEEPWFRHAVAAGLSSSAADVFAALAMDASFNTRTGAVEFLREAARVAGLSAPTPRVVLDLRIAARAPHGFAYASALAAGIERRGMTISALDGRTFEAMRNDARRVSGDASEEDGARVEAIELLGFANDTESRAALLDALSAKSAAVQMASLTALTRRGNATVFTNILARWPQLALATRSKVISIALSRREFTLPLLDAIQSSVIAPTEISAADAERLFTYKETAIRDRARSLLRRQDVARATAIEKYKQALSLVGDAARGRVIFQQRCATCHRLGNEGVAVGPDLASVASSGKEKLLTSILDPNAEVAAAFVAQTVETKSGETFVGVLAGENAQSVTLKLANGESMQIPRATISSLRSSNRSLMPEGLEEGLSAEQMADLLALIVSGGK